MSRKGKYILLGFLAAIPFIIYYYFFSWRTTTIYGDDLYIYKALSYSKNFSAFINKSISEEQKFRPVSSFCVELIFRLFKKNLFFYYLFNVFIHTANCYLLALLLNLFLRSPILSVLYSLVYGLSGFSYYNISQLFNGGALEGLAISFFLLSLFFTVKALADDNQPGRQMRNLLLWGIFFANLSLYTHERYIVLLPFIILVILLFPALHLLSRSQKIILSGVSFASILLNVIIKKWIFSVPFFIGTGHTNISFSYSSAKSFFITGLLSIFQINSGPEYLSGMPYASLAPVEKKLVLAFIAGLFFILALYLREVVKAFILKKEKQKSRFYIFLSLLVLFVFCLAPAIVTIRLEQRWLQAPLCIFMLMIAIALSNIPFKNVIIKTTVTFSFIIYFLWINYTYFHEGVPNLYMTTAKLSANVFKQAVDDNIVNPNAKQLYIYSKNDTNDNNALKWALGGGYFFEFYQGKSKEILFTNLYPPDPVNSSPLLFIDRDSVQVLSVRDKVKNITGQNQQGLQK